MAGRGCRGRHSGPTPARLQWLAARHPQAIAQHETACQVLAAAEWAAGDAASAAGIAAPWIENDTMSRGWLPLAMRLAADGRRCRRGQTTSRAIAVAFTKRTNPTDVAWGFIHLALMEAENIPLAASHLDLAFRADPTIPELRSFRGNLPKTKEHLQPRLPSTGSSHLRPNKRGMAG